MISGRLVSAESDQETLGRTGCIGEHSSNRSEIGSQANGRRFCDCARAFA